MSRAMDILWLKMGPQRNVKVERQREQPQEGTKFRKRSRNRLLRFFEDLMLVCSLHRTHWGLVWVS